VGGETFCTDPDQPWIPPSLLYNGHRVSFPEIKWPGHGIDHHPPPSSPEVKETQLLGLRGLFLGLPVILSFSVQIFFSFSCSETSS